MENIVESLREFEQVIGFLVITCDKQFFFLP